MEIFTAIEATLKLSKAALDLLKSAKSITQDQRSELREIINSLREELQSVKEEATALKEKNFELNKRLSRLADFQKQRVRYSLKRLDTGSLVYAPNPAAEVDEPPHYLCAPCFEKQIKSYLQFEDDDFHKDTYRCPECGQAVKVPNDKTMESFTVSTRKKWRDL